MFWPMVLHQCYNSNCSTAGAYMYQRHQQFNKCHTGCSRNYWTAEEILYYCLPTLVQRDCSNAISNNMFYKEMGVSFLTGSSCYKPVKAPFMIVYYGYYWTRFPVSRTDIALGYALYVYHSLDRKPCSIITGWMRYQFLRLETEFNIHSHGALTST